MSNNPTLRFGPSPAPYTQIIKDEENNNELRFEINDNEIMTLYPSGQLDVDNFYSVQNIPVPLDGVNVGTTGIGPFKQKNGLNYEFKNFNSLTPKISITESNDTLQFNFDETLIDHFNLINIGTYTHEQIDSHIDNTDNPHNVRIDQITPTTTKGDLMVETGVSVDRFELGTTGKVLTVNTDTNNGLQWLSLHELGNSAITATNVGNGSGVFKDKNNTTQVLSFKSIVPGSNINFNDQTNDITINLDTNPVFTDLTVQSLGVSGETFLNDLDVSNNTTLQTLGVSGTSYLNNVDITTLGVSGNTTLNTLQSNEGVFQTLGVSGYTHLNDTTTSVLDVTNNITVGGTVDGRDIATDGSTLDAHIADTSIHFTEASIDHFNIQNIGTNTHVQIDSHIASQANPHNVTLNQIKPTTTKGDLIAEDGTNAIRLPLGVTGNFLTVDTTQTSGLKWISLDNFTSQLDHFDLQNIGSYTHEQIDSHINNASIHFTEASINHLNIQNAGTNTHAQIDSHIADNTIHFTKGSITHTEIQDIGTYTHPQIDAHIDNTSIHFTEASINHANIQNIGTNTHAQIDSHIADGTIHFTKGSISHTEIQDIGTNTHAQIDAHISNQSNPHNVTIDQVTPTTTKGDLIVENGSNAVRLPLGTTGQVLLVNTDETTGLEWVDNDTIGEINTMSNVGSGTGVFKQKAGFDFELKSLVGGTNINLSNDTNTITINLDNTVTLTGDLTVDGDLTVNGTQTTVNTENVEIEDPLQKLASSNNADAVDIGTYGLYVDGGVTKFNGIFRDASDNTFKLFTGLQTEPTTTVDITGTGYTRADLDIGNLDVLGNIVVSGTVDGRDIAADGATQDAHIGDTSIHFTEASIDHTNIQNIGTNTHAQIDTHIADGTIHFTKGSITHTEIQDIGTKTHAQIDSHIDDTSIHFTEASIDHANIQNIGTNTHTQIDSHIADNTIHFTKGSISHTEIQDIGTNTHAQIDAHISNQSNPHNVTLNQIKPTTTKGDIFVDDGLNATKLDLGTTGQFLTVDTTQSTGLKWIGLDNFNNQLDHFNLQNIGTYTHAQIDSHINNSNIHFTEASISHLNIQDIGTNTHTQIDSHIADNTIHFTKGSISHTEIQDIGTNTHAQIDAHISNQSNPHNVTIDQVTPTTTKGDIIVENGSNAVRLAVGTDGQVLKSNSSAPNGIEWGNANIQKDVSIITEEYPTGTDGGNFVAGAWRTRCLNTLIQSTTMVTSLSSHQFTLAAGNYYIEAEATGFSVNNHVIRLRNITDSSTDAIGMVTDTPISGSTLSTIKTYMTLVTPKTFELQHRCQHSQHRDGFGKAGGFGINEVYSRVYIKEM